MQRQSLMRYQVWINDEAKTEIIRLPGHIRQRIRRAIQDLGDEPRPHYSHQMRAPEGVTLEVRRLRLERWRVGYIVDEEWSEVGVLAVRKRPPYDYKDLSALLERLE
jgi:mRNA-degrading endonuclease RelE of RelBE toxin-antitoxin system